MARRSGPDGGVMLLGAACAGVGIGIMFGAGWGWVAIGACIFIAAFF